MRLSQTQRAPSRRLMGLGLELVTAPSQWVGARLEPYKVPKLYRWVKALPRTESGKLLRIVLRDAVAGSD